MDYREYRFTKKEWLVYTLESAGITCVMAYLCYRSLFALAGFLLIYPFVLRKKRKERLKQRKSILSMEFKETMQAAAGALTAGYSMENAFREAQKEMEQLYGKESFMVKELKAMNAKIELNQPIEQLFLDFSRRSGIEDVESFCQVFSFAKRGGGDFVKIIKTTILRIADKIEVKREIETVIAAKKLEQKIMQAVPVVILLYLDITSPEFLKVLYGNLLGIGVMTICLVVYLAAIYLAEKIVDITV